MFHVAPSYGDPPPMQQQQNWQSYIQQINLPQQQLLAVQEQTKVLNEIWTMLHDTNQQAQKTNELLSVLIDLIPISDFASRGGAPKKKGKK